MADETEDPDDVLEISWEDLKEELLPPAPAEAPVIDLTGDLFPAVEAGAPVTDSRQPWVEVTGVCGRDRRPFSVRFTQTAPGTYTFGGAAPLPPSPPGKFSPLDQGAAKPMPPGPQGQAQGRFDLKGYPGCPCCGQPGLVQCDRCGTIMCGSALMEDRGGLWCHCPQCGGRGQIASGVAVTVQGEVGGVREEGEVVSLPHPQPPLLKGEGETVSWDRPL